MIVNADSQQLFADLPTLTARPSAADEAAAPHRLYGAARRRRAALGRPLADADRAGVREPRMPSGGRPSSSAAPASICRPSCTASRRCPPFRRHSAPSCALGRRRPRCGAFTPGSQRRDPAMAARLQPATASGCYGPSRWSRPPAARCSPGRPTRASGRFAGTAGRVRLGAARRPPSTRASRRGSCDAGRLVHWPRSRSLLARRPDALLLPIAKVHGLRELAAVLGGTLRPRAGTDRHRGPDPAIRQAPAHLVPPPAPRASAAGD